MKYNIALLPLTQNQSVIQLAQQFASIADTYLIGKDSLPHVTLSHFFAEETEAERIWAETCLALPQHTMQLRFPQFSYNSFKNNLYWISLLPYEFEQLKQMHLIVANIVKNPVSRSYDQYDPHMTLINTKNASAEPLIQSIRKKYLMISDEFTLALGKTDDVGQFTEIVFSR